MHACTHTTSSQAPRPPRDPGAEGFPEPGWGGRGVAPGLGSSRVGGRGPSRCPILGLLLLFSEVMNRNRGTAVPGTASCLRGVLQSRETQGQPPSCFSRGPYSLLPGSDSRTLEGHLM